MVFFVVPAYNEERNLPRLLGDLAALRSVWRAGGRVILVDDGSTDRTAAIAEAYQGAFALEVLRLGRNQGPGAAFDRGLRRALERSADDDDLVVTLEADTTSDLGALPQMFALARSGTDVVLASVHGGGELLNVSRMRALLSVGASWAVRRTSGVDAKTFSSFFRVYRMGILRTAFDRLGDGFIREPGFACQAEMLLKLARLGARVDEVPVRLDGARRVGTSTMQVLPTVRGYTRVMRRELLTRRGPA